MDDWFEEWEVRVVNEDVVASFDNVDDAITFARLFLKGTPKIGDIEIEVFKTRYELGEDFYYPTGNGEAVAF